MGLGGNGMRAFPWNPSSRRAHALAFLLCLAAPAAALGAGAATTAPGVPAAPLAAGSVAEGVVSELVRGIEDFLAVDTGVPTRLSVGDAVTAVERGNQVIVTFPDARLMFGEGGEAALGDVVVAVVPRDEGYYDVAMSLPSRVELRGGNAGQAPLVVLIGESRLTGLWSAETQTFAAADYSARDLRVGEKGGRPFLTVQSVAGTQDFTGGTPGVWTGPFDFALSGIHMEIPAAAGGGVDLAELRYAGTIEGFDMGAWQRIARETRGLVPGAPFPPEEIARLREIFSTLPWGRIDIEASLSGLLARQGDHTLFALDRASQRFRWDDTRPPGRVGFGMEIRGLDIRHEGVFAEMAPRRVGFDLTVDRFPVRAVFAAVILEILAMDPQKARDPEAFPLDTEALAGLILEARPRLTLDGVAFASDLLEMAAAGTMDSDPEAVRGFVGTIDATITGLDRAMRSISEKAKTDPEAVQLLLLLAMARGFAQVEPGIQGEETVLSYKIEVGRDGGFTINGTPLDATPQPDAGPLERNIRTAPAASGGGSSCMPPAPSTGSAPCTEPGR